VLCLDGSNEAVAVVSEGLDDVLPDTVIAYGLADHLQATCQGCLRDKLTGPAGGQDLVFRDRAVALCQKMDEHGEGLGLESTHNAGPPQLPAVDVECALTKDKDHGLASCS